MKTNKQIPLICSRQKQSKIQYEVQKQGVIFLRQLRNKKLRIIFNIITASQGTNKQDKYQHSQQMQLEFVQQFNQLLLNQNNPSLQSENYVKQQVNTQQEQNKNSTQPISPHLTLHSSFKQISQNRVIVIMNCYLPPHSPPYLLIFGYLISSLVLYHNLQNQFSQKSPLTSLLCQFSKLLRATNIDQLSENIKYKTGYEKTPYFLCLLSKNEKNKSKDRENKSKDRENKSKDRESKDKEEEDKKSHKQLLIQKREYQQWLNDFYRFRQQEQHSKINYALQTIIDFFPQRASLGLEMDKQNNRSLLNNRFSTRLNKSGMNQVIELGHQFQQTILGRQLFTFQFTSTTIQSLAFQLCHYFNTQKQLNLIQLYNSVIQNKKARLQIQYSHRFLQLVRQKIFLGNKIEMQQVQMIEQSKTIFPVSQSVLMKLLTKIKQTVRQEMLQDAVNCMQLWQYVESNRKVQQKIKQCQIKLMRLNAQCGQRFVEQCYSLVELRQQDIELVSIDETPQQQQKSIGYMDRSTASQQSSKLPTKPIRLATPQQTHQLFSILTTRLQSFTSQCSSIFTQNSANSQIYSQCFSKLSKSYLQIIGMKVEQLVQKVDIKLRQQQLESDTLKYQLNKSIKQRKLLQQQYQLQLLIEAQLKQQLKSLILSTQLNTNNYQHYKLQYSSLSNKTFNQQNHFMSAQKQFHKLKLKYQLLQQQLKSKNNHIEDLQQILNKFQTASKSLPDTKYIEKFTVTTKLLIQQANNKIKQFYTILQEVKQVEKHYQNAKKLLLKQKNQIMQDKKQFLKQIHTVKQQSEKIQLQNQKLYEIVVEEKKTIDNFNTLKDTLKNHIIELQAANTQLTCELAEEQSDKQLFRKALSLVVQNTQKGKSQNLSKFCKFLQHQQIKEMIKPIIGKK